MNPIALGAIVVLGAAGAAFTLRELGEGLAVEMQHYIMLLVILIAGYVAGRLFPQFGQMVGLP